MSALLGVMGGILLTAALVTAILLGGDKLPLAVTSAGSQSVFGRQHCRPVRTLTRDRL